MLNNDHAYAVILAGGGGTRLWPKSRTKTPKQFLKLTGQKTMMQLAAERIAKLVNWHKIIVVTNKLYEKEVRLQLPQVPKDNIICEPQKRDTALAMLVGALFAKSKDPQAVVINSASDHVLIDEQEFARVMKAAVTTAATEPYLVSVGITPTFPTSAFGYIKIGEDLKRVDRGLSLFKVKSFTEKPNIATAQAFISTGKYFWNANMYVWSAEELKKAFAKHMPAMHKLTEQLDTLSASKFHHALPQIYAKAESISIDYAISEKVDNLTLIPGDFGWNDVGDWKVVYDLSKKDLAGNVVMGDHLHAHVLTIGSHNNLIHSNGRLVSLIGVSDMIIVDTDEIVMIAPKSRSQDVKKLVERLKEEGKEEYL
ncbi:MAG: mannose-1-phosphate guanylyltransferase [Patescibacteria group bacterium]